MTSPRPPPFPQSRVRILRIWKRIGFLLRSYHPRYNKFVNDSKVVFLTAMLGLQGKNREGVGHELPSITGIGSFPRNTCTIARALWRATYFGNNGTCKEAERLAAKAVPGRTCQGPYQFRGPIFAQQSDGSPSHYCADVWRRLAPLFHR
jgi:hypothetical protein